MAIPHGRQLLSRSISLFLAVLTISAWSEASAATRTWQNTGSDFNTPGNWSTALPGTGDVGALPSGVTVVSPNLSAGISIQGLTIDNGGADYNLTQTGGALLTLGTAGLVSTGGGSTILDPEIRLTGARPFNTGSTALSLAGGIGIVSADTTWTLTNSTPISVSSIATRDATSSTTRTLSFNGAGAISVAGAIAPGSGSVAQVKLESVAGFTGTLSLNGSNTWQSGTVWRAGTLEIGNNSALGAFNIAMASSSGGAQPVSLLTSGAVTVAANVSFNGSAVTPSVTIGGSQTSGTSTFSGTLSLTNLTAGTTGGVKLTAAADGTVQFTNVISGAAGNGPITKIGAGVIRLTGTNTYAGGTVVSAGTLLINNTTGSGTGTGTVAVNGGTLGGTGIITGAVTVAGSAALLGGEGLAATQDLALTGGLTLQDGSIVSLALGSGGTHSTIARSGASTWTFDSDQLFSFVDVGAGIGLYDDLITGLGSNPGTTATWQIGNPGWAGTFSYDGANIDLNLTAIPEPSTWLLLSAGAALLFFRRTRSASAFRKSWRSKKRWQRFP